MAKRNVTLSLSKGNAFAFARSMLRQAQEDIFLINKSPEVLTSGLFKYLKEEIRRGG